MTDDDGYSDERPVCPLLHRDEQPRYSWVDKGTVLCGGHYRGLDSHLHTLPKLYELLAKAHLSSGTAVSYGSRSAEKPLIINTRVVQHRGRIIGGLAFHVAAYSKQHGLSDPAKYEVADMCQFLLRHLDWIVTTEDADDFTSNIADLHHDAKQLIWPDRQQVRTRIPCPVDDCEGTLRPMTDKDTKERSADDELLPAGLICTTCGWIVPAGEWRTLARDYHGMSGLMTEQSIELWAEVNQIRLTGPTIRQWATRGHIGRHEKNGRTLYDLDEIQARLDLRNADAA